jgi:hypothetical protein
LLQHTAARCPEGLQVEKEFLKGQCACVRHRPILNDSLHLPWPRPGILPLPAMRLLPAVPTHCTATSPAPSMMAYRSRRSIRSRLAFSSAPSIPPRDRR